MKSKITSETIIAYKYEETCDKCGKIIKRYGSFRTNIEPNCNEKDYCLSCLRAMIDNNKIGELI